MGRVLRALRLLEQRRRWSRRRRKHDFGHAKRNAARRVAGWWRDESGLLRLRSFAVLRIHDSDVADGYASRSIRRSTTAVQQHWRLIERDYANVSSFHR